MRTISILTTLVALTFMSYAQSNGWTIQSSPTSVNLYGVTYSNVNSNKWLAVGDGGTIIRSIDGGITWSNVTSPVVDALRGVALHGNIGLAVGISGRVVRSTDAGITWVEETRPTTRNLYSVSMSDFMTVITGHEGTIFVSYDNGLTWTFHTAGTASILFGVSVNGNTAVGVGGAGAVVMSVNGGSGWGLTVLGDQNTFFYSTSFVNSNTGWAVGSSLTTGNVIIKSVDAGFVWSGESAPTTEQLFGVSFSSLDSGTAVGSNGTIIHTVNGGATWLNQTSGTTQILNGVSFANSGLGITVGNAGTILRTVTGGLTGVNHNNHSIITKFELSQNYPNPFNPSTKINYQLPKSSFVKLIIYDVMGSKVNELVNSQQAPGSYTVEFDGVNLASGTYFYKLETDGFTETKKMNLIK
jgi:photosystem II stability/assembly factor-like uncharacterized protein